MNIFRGQIYRLKSGETHWLLIVISEASAFDNFVKYVLPENGFKTNYETTFTDFADLIETGKAALVGFDLVILES